MDRQTQSGRRKACENKLRSSIPVGRPKEIAPRTSLLTLESPPASRVSSPPGLTEVLSALATVMPEWTNRWYLFGAQAVHVWGRPKDLEDVRGVLRERLLELDLSRVRRILGLLDRALSRSDLERCFEREVQDASRAKK